MKNLAIDQMNEVVTEIPETTYTSCCGVQSVSDGDGDTSDYGVCPDCGDQCSYVND